MKQDVKTNDNTAPRVVLAFVFPITPPRDPVPPNKMGASTVVAKPTNRRKESRVGRVARWKRGGIMRGDARATRSHARPIPGRDQTSVGERRFASGRAGGGWLVTRMGSWRDGHHGHAAGRRAARGSPRQRARASRNGPKKEKLRRPNLRLGSIRQRARDTHRFRRRIVVVSFQIDGRFNLERGPQQPEHAAPHEEPAVRVGGCERGDDRRGRHGDELEASRGKTKMALVGS